MGKIIELNHPLVRHHMTRLRDKHSASDAFRARVRRLSAMLAYEACRDLRTMTCKVETPLVETEGRSLSDRIGLVPILRAGLGMVDPVLDMIPSAEVWHLGFYRDETTFQPVQYYHKLEGNQPVDVAFILDPMLATGGSAVAAFQAVQDWGVQKTCLLSMIAAPEGIEKVRGAFPEADIYVCQIDEKLNDQAYILPGLGDAGDRIFNTLK